jgi:hypothetical protein
MSPVSKQADRIGRKEGVKTNGRAHWAAPFIALPFIQRRRVLF